MTRYLLDTNIISNIVKPQPPESLLDWMSAQQDEDLYIASLTVAEIRRGILEKPRSKKRDAFETWFSGPEGATGPVRGANTLVRRQGRPHLGAADGRGQDGGSPAKRSRYDRRGGAGANDCIVVTDNEKDFGGLQIVNPSRREAEAGEG